MIWTPAVFVGIVLTMTFTLRGRSWLAGRFLSLARRLRVIFVLVCCWLSGVRARIRIRSSPISLRLFIEMPAIEIPATESSVFSRAGERCGPWVRRDRRWIVLFMMHRHDAAEAYQRQEPGQDERHDQLRLRRDK